MNSTLHQPPAPRIVTFKRCHPERGLARSEAIRKTESKDPMCAGRNTGYQTDFRIVIRFLDEHEIEHLPISGREAVTWETRAWQCRVNQGRVATPGGKASGYPRRTIQ